MRFAYLLICLFSYSFVLGQKFILPQGEYMDTTMTNNPKCDPSNLFYYYQVNTKYPLSTMNVLTDVKAFLSQRGKKYSGNGYITLRFIVDCEGNIYKVKVLQVDENYKPFRFERAFISDLNDYIHTLNKWQRNISVEEYKNVNYIAYLSFKVRNGEVVNVIY